MFRNFVILGLVTVCSTILPVPCPRYENRKVPDDGGFPYNPITQKCCSGKTINNDDYTKCCGNSSYDSTEGICCGGVIQKLKYGLATRCCGTETYNVKIEICCGETRIPMSGKSISSALCCGNRTYDDKTEICCSYQDSFTVVKKNRMTNIGCCNGKSFNSKESMCCTGYKDGNLIQVVVRKEDDKTICCGTNAYDYNKEVCCFQNGKTSVVKKDNPEDTYCCNGKSYSANAGICCNDTLIKYDNVSNYYGMQCCGSQLYNYSTQACCIDTNDDGQITKQTVIDGKACCGTTSYDYESQICCGKTTYDFDAAKSKSCCGEKLYDYNTEICCGNQIMKMSESGQTGCCTSYVNDDYPICNPIYYKKKK